MTALPSSAPTTSSSLLKDTSVVGLISNNDETHYREEVAQLAEWCGANSLSLSVSKTKEVVMDFRQNSGDNPPLTIDSSTVERVSSTKFLGVHITKDLTWTTFDQDCKALQRVVRLAERISGSTLPSLQVIYLKCCKSRAAKIIKDSNHPGNHLFHLLPSGKRFRSMMAKTERLRRSFFPQAIRLLNTNSV